MYRLHAEEYDATVVKNKWKYKLSTEANDASAQTADNVRDPALPQFSPAAFLERLVCFIVADDQVGPHNIIFFLMLMWL